MVAGSFLAALGTIQPIFPLIKNKELIIFILISVSLLLHLVKAHKTRLPFHNISR